MLYAACVNTMTGQASQEGLPKLTYSAYCKKQTHIEHIGTCGMDESMAHSLTQNTSGTSDSISHGCTDEVACRPVAGNSGAAAVRSDHPLAVRSTIGH